MTDNPSEPPDPAASATSRIGRAFAWIDQRLELVSDYINPILVKETRQALKSQQFVIWYLLLLGGCWIVTIGGLAMIGPAAYYGAFGGQLFQWYAWILSFPLLVVAPFSAFRSLASEQEENTRDVLTVSALSPYQVINGKLGSSALQVAMYLSAMAPCLAFAYLLRGVDALTLVLLPGMGVVASLGLSLVGLLLASLARVRYLQIMMNVVFITALLLLFYNSFELIEELVENGYRSYQQTSFWIAMGAIATAVATTFLLAYALAVACNTFTSANRSTPLRAAMLVQQAAFIGWMAAVWLVSRDPEIAVAMFMVGVFYWTAMGMFLTSEEPVLSPRVRRTLPKTAIGRAAFTLLSPGPGTGFFFVLANLCYLLLLAWFVQESGRSSGPGGLSLLVTYLAAVAYVVSYLGFGRIVIMLLRKIAALSLIGGFLVHLLLLLAGNALPYAIDASFNSVRRAGFSYWDVVSPVAMLEQTARGNVSEVELLTTGLIVFGVAACSLLINLFLAAAEVRQSRLTTPQRIIEDELAKIPAPGPTNPWGDSERPAVEAP
ncbi:hypothetical protein Pla123a_47020 [Posidoniimonas polymericola]|uniref:ABC-2 family transporter protein n=1 Tax=Posidoniimonas polymericola TaxID=2528002 RepID=A0A5C5XUA6_9BACT|nr:hypothetical protein [Posidoniimonas polymericola]TWT66308.1 hypothetical protein Pla123a_47020 [Posidoniimonas polymericola]